MTRNYNLLSLVIPMYNEESVLDSLFFKLFPVLDGLGSSYEIVCINDGSRDKTLEHLLMYQKKYKDKIVVVDFHKNFGKESALTAGLEFSRGDIVIPIDADLQDPPELIPRLIEKWQQGADEVLAVRGSRLSDTFLKRFTAIIFYKIFNTISSLKIEYNAGDYRLIDRSIVDIVLQLPEKNRFMKGIFSWASSGHVEKVEYVRDERVKGKSKFSYWKLFNFALDGVTSFSSLPLRIWSYVGAVISMVSFLMMIFLFVDTLIIGNAVRGWASMMCVLLFLGGVQLLSLGIMGEYIARIYTESKNRPLYVVRKCYRGKDSQ